MEKRESEAGASLVVSGDFDGGVDGDERANVGIMNVMRGHLKKAAALFSGPSANVLNSEGRRDEVRKFSADEALELSSQILQKLRRLHSAALRESSTRVDYDKLAASEAFASYRESIALLPSINPRDLPKDHYLCFFLNIYNALLLHAMALGRQPRSLAQRLQLYGSASYEIGPFGPLSLNDIEHGILRNNSPMPIPFASRPFGDDDPRIELAIEDPDPRIHFALNCGAISCPPISLYTPDKVHEQLQLAAENYIRQEVVVDEAKAEVRLSMIFRWYERDFAGEGGLLGTLRWLQPFLESEQAKELGNILETSGDYGTDISVLFRDYNWGVNEFKSG